MNDDGAVAQLEQAPLAEPMALTAPVEGEGIVAEFNAWLRQLVQEEGSDLHVKVGSAPLLRVDGRLRRLDRQPLTPEEATALGEAIVPPDRAPVFAERGEADFAHSLAGVGRFRVNVFRQRG